MRQHSGVQSRVSSERSRSNTSMSPACADLIWAAEFLADFESRGSVIRDGSDPPRLGRARALIEHARALGIQSV